MSRGGWAARIAACALVASCSHRAQPVSIQPRRATLFVFSDVRGYLEPCGCSEGMRGGIARAAGIIEAERARGASVAVFDAGDSLLEGKATRPDELPEVERRARAVAAAFLRMGVLAHAVGSRDDSLGVGLRRQLGLEEIADGKGRVVELGGPDAQVAWVAGNSVEMLTRAARTARSQGARFVVAAWNTRLDEAQRGADALTGLVDVLVASRSDDLAGEESRLVRAAVPVVQLQSKGRSLLRIDLSFGADAGSAFTLQATPDDVSREATALEQRAELLARQLDAPGLSAERKILVAKKRDELVARRAALLAAPLEPDGPGSRFELRFVPVESILPKSSAIEALVMAYDHDVDGLNLAWAKAHGRDCPKPSLEEPGVVGNAVCLGCHPAAGPVWQASRHAHAYDTLKMAGKTLHTACVGCHVTGYGQPGGVCRVDKVEGRSSVGCESCHGPGSTHASAPVKTNIVGKPSESRCVVCHTHENSPHFDFALYRPQILGPGHGVASP